MRIARVMLGTLACLSIVLLGAIVLGSVAFGGAPYTDNSLQRQTVIPLTRYGKINTYSVRETGSKTFEFTAINVEDPVKKKPITGEVELQYKCGRIPYINRLFLRSGSSQPLKVECLVLVTPRIIISEEE